MNMTRGILILIDFKLQVDAFKYSLEDRQMLKNIPRYLVNKFKMIQLILEVNIFEC
jgi:hypothetical protein